MEKETWFSSLYDTHAGAVWRYFAVRLNNPERANDLTHDVFLKCWQAVQTGETIVYERAYLFTIAKRLFLNEIRQKREVTSFEVLTENGFDVPDQTELADQVAANRELWQYLGAIRDTYREALLLRYVDGLTVKEIAVMLAEKETNISMRIARGLAALKTLYDKASPYDTTP